MALCAATRAHQGLRLRTRQSRELDMLVVTCPVAIVTNASTLADRLSFGCQVRGSMSSALDQMANRPDFGFCFFRSPDFWPGVSMGVSGFDFLAPGFFLAGFRISPKKPRRESDSRSGRPARRC